MTDLIRLAERVEALAGPDRSLDLEIAVAVWGRPGVLVMRHDKETGENYEYTHWEYTGSLDSAISLVPEGMEIELTNLYGVGRASVGLNVECGPWYGEDVCGGLIRALTAASLRSLAAQRGQS